MFCPSCGTEERFSTQFCRSCGSNLRIIRTILEKPDRLGESTANARIEIGRAFAHKIRQTNDPAEMQVVAKNLLPEIKKFLESPEESRLRRVRAGSLLSFVGLGASIAFSIIASISDRELFVIAGAGFVAFCIGLSFIVNGLFFTTPKRIAEDAWVENEGQPQLEIEGAETNELVVPQSGQVFSSVVEETTRQLEEQPGLQTPDLKKSF